MKILYHSGQLNHYIITTDSTAVDSGGDGTVVNVGKVTEMDYSAAVDKGVGGDVVVVVDAVASKRKQGAKRQRQKQKQKQKPNRFAAPAEPRIPQGIHVGEWIAGVECTGIHQLVIDLT